jgi:hypothetical protein
MLLTFLFAVATMLTLFCLEGSRYLVIERGQHMEFGFPQFDRDGDGRIDRAEFHHRAHLLEVIGGVYADGVRSLRTAAGPRDDEGQSLWHR